MENDTVSAKEEKRLGFVGIIIESRELSAAEVNRILSEHGDSILVRVGLPQQNHGCAVITLVVETTTDDLGRLTGRLGQVRGVSVKSALARPRGTRGETTGVQRHS